MPLKKSLILYLIPLVVVLGVFLNRSRSAPWSDYAGYYFGGKELLKGHYAGAYDMQTLNDEIAVQGYKGVLVSYAPFPPFTSLVFAPFTTLPLESSKWLFNLFSTLLFIVTLWRCIRYFNITPYIALAVPVIFFIPLINNLFFGQSYLLLCSLLLEGYLAYRKERPILSSFLWAIAILFKLFPGLIFLFLLLRRKYRSVFYLGIACGILVLPSLAVNGLDAWKFYLSRILPKMNNGELNDPFTFIFQSFYMLVKRAFIQDQLLNPHPLIHSPYLFAGTMALFKALILSACVLLTLRRKEDDFLPFAVWITASMLISPNGSSYSLILLMIPLLALAARSFPWRASGAALPASVGPLNQSMAVTPARPATGWQTIVAALLLLAACMVPVIHLSSYPLWAQFPRLYLLLLFFGVLAGPLKKALDIRLVAGWAVLFFAVDIPRLQPDKDTSSYLLTREEHLYIYDYTIKNDRLVYYYRDDKGSHETTTAYPVYFTAADGLSLQNNQIWYKGRQLTFSPDQKEKALLVNDEYIIYLSDKNRGVEFYTLRQLRLDEEMRPRGQRAGGETPADPATPLFAR